MYDTFMRPLLMQYEPDIEERFRNLRLKFGRLLIYYLKNFTEKGQILFIEVLRYVVSKASGSTEVLDCSTSEHIKHQFKLQFKTIY